MPIYEIKFLIDEQNVKEAVIAIKETPLDDLLATMTVKETTNVLKGRSTKKG